MNRFSGGATVSAWLLSMIVTLVPAQADQFGDAQACTSLADSLQRLTCFDRVFPKEGVTTASSEGASEPALTAWEVRRERSAIDDSPSVFATLLPSETSSSGLANRGLAMMARCSENRTAFLIHTDMFMTDDPQVTVRLGDAPAETTHWSRSSNYQAAGLWSGATAIPFLKKLKNGQRMVVRVESRERQDAIFNLANVEEVVAEIAAACSWAK